MINIFYGLSIGSVDCVEVVVVVVGLLNGCYIVRDLDSVARAPPAFSFRFLWAVPGWSLATSATAAAAADVVAAAAADFIASTRHL